MTESSLALERPRRPDAYPPHEVFDFAGAPGGVEAGVVSSARSFTHLRDALSRVLVDSWAPAADAARSPLTASSGHYA